MNGALCCLSERRASNRTRAAYSAAVRNGTAWHLYRHHDGYMLHSKRKKAPDHGTHASVHEELAKPRMAKSARIRELNLDTARLKEPPTTTMRGTVKKIVPSRRPRQREKAEIAVDGPDRRYRHLRIENSLTDEHGDDVKLKKGAHVEVSVTAETKNVDRHK
jgi:hypothetical protein